MSSFWNFIWIFFWSFAFIAYLMALFSIVADIFRDRTLNGWAKAVWIIFLIFVPFLTALVYLIARGTSMGERTEAQASRVRSVAASYNGGAAASSPAEEISKAKALLDNGTITDSEYSLLKARALGNQLQH